jgi:hypothetical protein
MQQQLVGAALPDIKLPATDGRPVDLMALGDLIVLYT